MKPRELVLKVAGFAGGVITVALMTWAAGWTGAQVLATTIFLGFILGTLLFWQFRLGLAMVGVLALLATGVLDVPHLIEFASLDVILFLIGMMIVIAFLEKRRFFEVMVERILRRVDRRAWHLLTAFMVMGAVSAALVDEVTSILFMTAVGLQLTRRFKLDPVPIVIMLVFATNIGSSATVVGNPIGVMIALRAGLTFTDFLRTATPIATGVLLLAIPLSFLAFPGALRSLALALREHRERVPIPIERMSRRDFRISMLVFGVTILGLVFHHPLEAWLGLGRNSLLVGVPLGAGGLAILLEGTGARDLVERKVDWWTLCFFMLLFASAGTLRYTGVTGRIAEGFLALTGGNPTGLLVSVTWGSGILSAFLDNVLAVATVIPVLSDLGQLGHDLGPLWWGLLFGGTLLGNLTLIGSTANIVALGILERDEKIHMSFLRWLRPGLIVAVPTLALATLILWWTG